LRPRSVAADGALRNRCGHTALLQVVARSGNGVSWAIRPHDHARHVECEI
jgi:hypothetical protein